MKINNPASGSIKEDLHLLLGQELYEKYSDILPLLALCQYRYRTYKSYGSFDMIFNTEETSAALQLYRAVIYPFIYIRNLFSGKSDGKRVMLSATVLKNDRYRNLLENIDGYTVVKTNLRTDIFYPSLPLNIRKYSRQLFGKEKKYFAGYSVTGRKLKKVVLHWLEFVRSVSENNYCEKEQMVKILDALHTEFYARVKKAEKSIGASCISVYITINQYNIRDLIFITACKNLGIKTKQLEHHASRFMHNIAEKEDIYRFCFVDDICCWNDNEVIFHNNIYKYECFPDKCIDIYAVGNPEILFSDAVSAVDKYPVQNRVTFMVSGIINATDSDAVASQLSLRNEIFESLKKLSDNTGVKILVRYPPGIDAQFRNAEESRLKGLGFDISPSDRASLLSDICASRAVIGTISSVLGLSALMGKNVYQIVPENEKYYITDKNITCISPSEVAYCDVGKSSYRIESSDFINYEKLFKI